MSDCSEIMPRLGETCVERVDARSVPLSEAHSAFATTACENLIKIEGSIEHGTVPQLRRRIQEVDASPVLRVEIDSAGGMVEAAVDAHLALRSARKPVQIHIGKKAHSAASLIAAAGDDVTMHCTATMLIHLPYYTAQMVTASELRRAADVLDQRLETMLDLYARRARVTRERMRRLIHEERELTAFECLEIGLIDRVTGIEPETHPEMKFPATEQDERQ